MAYVWLVEIDAGRVFRFASEAVTVETAAGEPLEYLEGLTEPSVPLDVGSVLGEATASIEIVSAVDWAAIVARGVPIEGRLATLLRWRRGDTYEQARVILRGVVRGVGYGALHEPFTASIVRSLAELGEIYPPPQAVIDASTWPITGGHTTPDEGSGTVYPIVIGSPGINGSGSAIGALQCYYAQIDAVGGVATSYIVVGDGVIEASTVRLYVRDEKTDTPILTTPSNRTVSQVTDLLGRTVSVITPAASGSDTVEDVRFFVGFSDSGGGGIRDRRGTPLRGAGDVLAWVLYSAQTYPVDYGRVESARGPLNVYKIDTVIAEPTNLWEWLQSEISPALPIEWRESTEGIYPAVLRWTPTREQAVQRLVAGSGGTLQRVSSVSIDAEEIYNEITVEYGPRAGGGGEGWRFRRIATSTARALSRGGSPSDDERVRGSYHLAESQRVYGVRPLVLQLGAVWDHTTADLVLRDLVERHAWPRRRVTYVGGEELEARRQGDIVTITDPDIYLEDEIAIVESVTPSGGSAEIALVLVDHPIARLRRVE